MFDAGTSPATSGVARHRVSWWPVEWSGNPVACRLRPCPLARAASCSASAAASPPTRRGTGAAPARRWRDPGACGDDRQRAALRQRADLPGPVRPAGAHLAVGRRRRGRDGPSGTGALGQPGHHRAGDRQQLARLAHGMADDLVTTLCLATTAPVAVAPAMNHRMWLHPATQANIATLRSRGVQVIGPKTARWPKANPAPAAWPSPPRSCAALNGRRQLSGRALAGCRILVSAGPTYEDIDPVRYIGNRSSGKMGFAIAAAAVGIGARGRAWWPARCSCPRPRASSGIDVRCAAQMHAAVLARCRPTSISAPPPWPTTPRRRSPAASSRRRAGEDTLTLELVKTRDILAEVALHPQRPRLVVGFAAETDDVAALCARQAGGQAPGPDLRQPGGRRRAPALKATTTRCWCYGHDGSNGRSGRAARRGSPTSCWP